MEQKDFDIYEILKGVPAGIQLYSPLCGNVEFTYVESDKEKAEAIWTLDKNGEYAFDKNGRWMKGGEVLLFPSKEMRDWSKFFKKGDVLVYIDGKCKVIFDKFDDDKYTSFIGKHYLESYGKDGELQDYEEIHCGSTVKYTKESEEAAQTYIKTIEKRLGGKLNHETLEIENAQPEFKDGDIAFADYGNRQDVFIVSDKTDLSEGYSSFISLDLNSLTLSMGCRTTFFKKDICKLRLATEAEKQQLFSALEKEGKSWDAEKKAIMDLKPKCEFKPFDKVLSRRCSKDYWVLNFYSHKTDYYHVCIDGSSNLDCIPYNEETAHLLGTTDEWKGGEG